MRARARISRATFTHTCVGAAQVARQVREACREVGFFMLVGHGITEEQRYGAARALCCASCAAAPHHAARVGCEQARAVLRRRKVFRPACGDQADRSRRAAHCARGARRQVQARSTLRARRHGDARLLTAVLLCAAGAMRFRVRVCVRVCVRVRVRVRALLCISAHVHQHAQPGLDSSGRAGERGAIPPPLPTVLAVRLFALMSVSVSIADAEPREADAGRHQGRSACANVYV